MILGKNEEIGGKVTKEEAEAAIREVWQRILCRTDIQGESDFFAVGGDSVLGAMLMASIADMSGTEMDVMDLYENPTLEQQAHLLISRVMQNTAATKYP